MSVSFLGLNSSFDSSALVNQLVQLETQSKLVPLETKRVELQSERSYLDSVVSSIGTVRTAIDFDDIIKGRTSLSPKLVTTSNNTDANDNEFVGITTTDSAVGQSFDINVSQLATNTVRRSTAAVQQSLTTASGISLVNFKTGSRPTTGTVTINGETRTYTDPSATIRKSASAVSDPTTIDATTLLTGANFKDGATLTGGTVTLNGEQQTLSITGTSTVQDLLDFFDTFSGVTSDFNGGAIQLTGVSSVSNGTSNALTALGIDTASISSSTVTGDHNISSFTMEDYGVTDSSIVINGTTVNFNSYDTISTFISNINSSAAAVTASWENNELTLTNDDLGGSSITVTPTAAGSVYNEFGLTDETLGVDADVQTAILDFLEGFSSISSATVVNGKVTLAGTTTNIGGAGDTSSFVAALGLDNSQITGGAATGLQNIYSYASNATMADIGVTSTDIIINGSTIAIESTDSISSVVTKINNDANAKVSAAWDSLEGQLVITNDDTGALNLTASTSSGNIISTFNISGGETIGNNAEFTISTVNNGNTLVSNSNEVSGIITGVTMDLNEVTSGGAVSVTIAEDTAGVKEKFNAILDATNDMFQQLDFRGDTFSRNLISQMKSQLTSIVGVSGTDSFTSLIDIGLESQLDGEGKFIGYALDSTAFDEAFDENIEHLYQLLYGSSNIDSIYSTMSNGEQGLITQFKELLDGYSDPNVPSNGVIGQVQDSISSQINSVNDSIDRAQNSIESLENRLRRQFSQLDIINAEFQQQQSAVSGLASQLG